ncbi:MAG: hypothetical protein LBR91_00465 [Puniceicoccales bacterium]|jgi:hypothetical protein|nr:hypothetical protein [Puniceicoccales bacterium]
MKLSEVVFATVLFVCTQVHGGEFDSLIENSPFVKLSRRANGDAGAWSAKPVYELTTVIITDRYKTFNIFVVSENKNVWIREGETVDGISVDSYDVKTKTLRFHTNVEKDIAVRLKNAD